MTVVPDTPRPIAPRAAAALADAEPDDLLAPPIPAGPVLDEAPGGDRPHAHRDGAADGTGADRPAALPIAVELELPTGAGIRTWTHPALRPPAGRPRAVAEALVWLDGADAPLAEAGLLLERPRRGADRLLRCLPERPCPAAPAAVLREVALGEAPREAGGATVAPVAAFTGRRSEADLAHHAGPVRAVLLDGILRGVTAEAAVARLVLSGSAAAVLPLCEAVDGRPARATLPEVARALALDMPPRARARGAPDLSGCETVGEALRGAMAHLGEVLLHLAPEARLGAGPEPVHGMRVAARRLRSVLKVFRPLSEAPSLRTLDARTGQLARLLGGARDWDVFLGGTAARLAASAGPEPRLAALLRAAEGRRRAGYEALSGELDGPGFRALARALVAAAHGEPWHGELPDPALADAPLREHGSAVMGKRWRKLLAGGEAMAELDDAALHELRLSAKRLRYAGEVFVPLWPGKPARRFLARLAALQEALGLANDAAVARGLAASLAGRDGRAAWAAGLVEGWALRGASSARRDARDAWKRFARTDAFW